MFNPFQHQTNVQQTSLKTTMLKCEKSWVENIVAIRRNCSLNAISPFVTRYMYCVFPHFIPEMETLDECGLNDLYFTYWDQRLTGSSISRIHHCPTIRMFNIHTKGTYHMINGYNCELNTKYQVSHQRYRKGGGTHSSRGLVKEEWTGLFPSISLLWLH